ncbi:MAG: ATP-grasp domain-containing protein [Candidatus Pacebacteria bacterium]|nr:ATP-grasp domain-containing protein [Candidatus Paceibacterota bacterium]
MKRVLYFTPVIGSYAMKRFQKESKKMGFGFKAIQYKHISLEFNKKAEFKYKGKKINFEKNDMAVLRNPKFKDSKDHVFFDILLNHLNSLTIKTINLNLFLNLGSARDKLFQYYLLEKNNFPIIKPTYFLNSNYLLSKKLESINSSFIVKPRSGSRGVDIFKIENEMDFIERGKDYSASDILIQKFVPNSFDLRIICTRKKIIGAMSRSAKEGSVVNNFSAGGSIENFGLNDKKIIKDCLEICKLFQCDYLGIDIILTGKKYLILEVNFFCDFKGFEEATGANFPKEIINLLK